MYAFTVSMLHKSERDLITSLPTFMEVTRTKQLLTQLRENYYTHEIYNNTYLNEKKLFSIVVTTNSASHTDSFSVCWCLTSLSVLRGH
jgi:hypothetical protein